MNHEFIPSFTPCVLTVVIIWNICRVSVDMSRIFSLESLTLCLWPYQGVKKQLSSVRSSLPVRKPSFLDVFQLDSAFSVWCIFGCLSCFMLVHYCLPNLTLEICWLFICSFGMMAWCKITAQTPGSNAFPLRDGWRGSRGEASLWELCEGNLGGGATLLGTLEDV